MHSTPPMVRWLGYGGLVPFIALTLLSFVSVEHAHLISPLLIQYGCIILTFVGALHWGVAMTWQEAPETIRAKLYVWSVIPSLVSWVCLSLPALWSLVVLSLLFWVQLAQDLLILKMPGNPLPTWYKSLRIRLTGVVCACLMLSFLQTL